MSAFTDTQIRQAIASEIQSVAQDAIVWPRFILGLDFDSWPGFLRLDSGRVHGYAVTRSAIGGESVAGGHFEHLWTYLIIGLRSYDTAADSEDSFSAELTALVDHFAARENLAASIQDQEEPLTFPDLDFNELGGELVHIAVGRLVVRLC